MHKLLLTFSAFSFRQHQLTTDPEPPRQLPAPLQITRYQYSNYTSPINSSQTTMTVPSTCCGRSGEACVCATQAKCSCGKQSALECNCEKAKTENTVAGARCSCRKSSSAPPRTRCCGELALTTTSPPLLLVSDREVWIFIDADMINLIGARPVGECTCERAATENAKPAGSTCACGARPASESTSKPLATAYYMP